MTPPPTCCGKGGADCVCAQNATCSCGKEAALHCTCGRAAAENSTAGPRCMCGQRAAGTCTCGTDDGSKTAAVYGGDSANETDFTTRK
ncbi:copper resistance protein [Niveomyces insectorum RCEF 264]|uniref:Copper resistance protein n=1 Tax=Niveomyces insectorum RCEF 264 TaxID=1081102 RepID=A0A167QRS7_9HYPO|nr:copper resistance protein [Niveomyces insectorum RCEF 264]